jgi:Domain of unknown function (DUF427)
MLRAVWNGAVLAESEHTVKVEGNHYFPAESLHREYFADRPCHQHLPVEGPGPVLPRQRGRHGQPGRGLALPAAEPRCRRDRRACRVLAWVRVERVPGPDGEATDGAGRGLAGRIRARLHRARARP